MTKEPKTKEGWEADKVTKSKECKECCEKPCVWLVKRDEMIDFDSNKHNHMPEADGPPDNI
jgi:hypothetical protein